MPFETATLTAFALATLATYLAPGADMAYVAANSIPHGVRAGLLAGLGCLTGIIIQTLAAAFGATAIFASSPFAFDVVRWAGVAYLLYLGVQILRADDQHLDSAKGPMAPFAIWRQGLMINLLNPKISLFFFAFLPQFVDRSRDDVFLQLLLLGTFFVTGAVVWLTLQAFVFARLGRAIAGNRLALVWQRRLTGFAMIGFSGVLAVAGVRR